MSSREKFNLKPQRSETREDSDSALTSNALRTRFATHMFIDPKEGKTDRENYVTREDSRRVSENVTKSVVTRSVIDKRSSSSYKTREDKSVKKRDLKATSNSLTDRSNLASSSLLYLNADDREAPVSSFYASNSKDKHFSDVAKEGDHVEDAISFLYRSANDTKICDRKAHKGEGSKDSNHNTSKLRFLETNREASNFGDDSDALVSHERGGSSENRARKLEKNYRRENDNVKDRGLEDTNILRRSLERKQASNSLERDRIAKRFSVHDSFDSPKHISKTYVSLSDKWRGREPGNSKYYKDSPFLRDQSPFTQMGRGDDEVDYRGDGTFSSRSLSLEALNDNGRDELKIYRELPGRKEFLSYIARGTAGEERDLSRENRRQSSLQRDDRSSDRKRQDSFLRLRSKSSDELRELSRGEDRNLLDYQSSYPLWNGASQQGTSKEQHLPSKATHDFLRQRITKVKADTETMGKAKNEVISPYSVRKEPSTYDTARGKEDREKDLSSENRHQSSLERGARSRDRKRRDSLLRLRSKSSDELRELSRGENSILLDYPSNCSLWIGASQGGSSEELHSTGKATHDFLRQDVTNLKAGTESVGKAKTDLISPYSVSKGPSSHDKLKEDIAKLKVETLTREHPKPYIPPTPSRVKLEDHSFKRKSRQTSIQEKLKEDIAKLKDETRDFPSLTRRASDTTTGPDSVVKEKGDIVQSGATTSLFERYAYSKRDGNVFEDGMQKKESQRYGDPDTLKYIEEHRGLKMDKGNIPRVERYNDETVERGFPESSQEYGQPTHYHGKSDLRRSDGREDQEFFKRKPKEDRNRKEEVRVMENENSSFNQRYRWEEPLGFSKEIRRGSTQGYATKHVFRADSTMSMTSNKNGDHGPSSVSGFFHGSVSEEDQCAYYQKDLGDQERSNSRDPFRKSDASGPPESFRQPQSPKEKEHYKHAMPHKSKDVSTQRTNHRSTTRGSFEEPVHVRHLEYDRQKEGAIPLPYTEIEENAENQDDFSISPLTTSSKEEHVNIARDEKGVTSSRVQRSNEVLTKKTSREDLILPRTSSTENIKKRTSRQDIYRNLSEQSDHASRTRLQEELFMQRNVISQNEIVEPILDFNENKPSAMRELKKKVEQLKSKVDALDDSKSLGQLERYVDEHSEKKPDVEIKNPVYIPRYQPTTTEIGSGTDGVEPKQTAEAKEPTSDTISRQISRQTSTASTTRRVSGICDEDLPTSPSSVYDTKNDPEKVLPTGKSSPREYVMVQTRDAQTMTTPGVEEQIGRDRYRRANSLISDIMEEPEVIEELRGVPIDPRGNEPPIQEIVDTGDMTDSGVATIQIDTQQPLSSRKCWWNAFSAEDVDRLLEIEHPPQWNPYTAEDMDNMWQLGPIRRRSLRRGSYGRRSFKGKPLRTLDDAVNVYVRVRGRQERPSRAQRIIAAQAAPQEKAIVLRADNKETADPFIRKIKVDDIYGADAVRVENGIVKIKVGDLSSKGRKAWARILQQKDRIVESDGNVTIPVSRDQYTDGVYYTNYPDRQQQDGALRMPIKFKFQEDGKLKSKKARVAREMKKAGSIGRRRRTAGSRAYIVGARYYHCNMLKSTASYGSPAEQKGIVLRGRRLSPRLAGNAIVLRGRQPYTVPMNTVQKIHAGHKVTRQAASMKEKDGKMVITVHAIPPQPPRFNLQQAGHSMTQSSSMLTSGSYYDRTPEKRDVSSISRSYLVHSGDESTSRGYTTYSSSGRQGASFIATDPSNAYRRRSSRVNGIYTLANTSNEASNTPSIVPYEGDSTPGKRTRNYNHPLVADPSRFYKAPGSRIKILEPRIHATTAYGENFITRDYGGMSKMQYVNGKTGGNNTIMNNRRWHDGRYRYGSSWNTNQQEKLNGRTMSWVVEEVAPDF